MVVPQQPPTMLAPNSSIKRRIASEKSSARSGYSVRPSTRIGNPAFGTTENGRFQCLAMCARCGVISVGPVAQFKPSEAIGNGRSAFTTALMSEPKSIVPVVSIVTETRIGISRTVFPAASSASKHAVTAHLICKRSWQVSIMKQSAPPSIKPRACSRYESVITDHDAWPSVISFVPGPIDPATNRGRPGSEYFAHAARAICAALTFRSYTQPTISSSKSAATSLLVPNVSVSTTSAPAARKLSWMR